MNQITKSLQLEYNDRWTLKYTKYYIAFVNRFVRIDLHCGTKRPHEA